MLSQDITHYEIVIVGGGVAGLCAAAFCGDNFRILERNNEAGKKLLFAGSGQCNITHAGKISDFLTQYGNNQKARFVKPALFAFDNIAVTRFFAERGITLFEREDGKIFPQSMQSQEIRDALFKPIKEKILVNTTVKNVTKIQDGFLIETESSTFLSTKLILTTGGCSYPSTGSKGDGLKFAKSLGHKIITPQPALVPIIVQNFKFADSAGTSFLQTQIEIFRNKKRIYCCNGDVLLTHRGLSGPGILDLSRYIKPLDEIRISIIDAKSESEIFIGKKTLKNVLANSGIPLRFVIQLLHQLDVPLDLPAAETPREIRQQLKFVSFTVEQTGSWNEAMSTAGGVATDEINRYTMESRIVPNLFFAGEILDVDGNCGGYNIQFALASGKLAATSAQNLTY
ncbi:MAG: aminoacetone oxidase family FAD-binding enzyme [Planctomycetaceae bacterium]|jgi:predicted Rossmann fold flavoprotein|nr:aminoacetone oxidase family FAD-binding enzyme [Planctomycetaceae bacterium]